MFTFSCGAVTSFFSVLSVKESLIPLILIPTGDPDDAWKSVWGGQEVKSIGWSGCKCQSLRWTCTQDRHQTITGHVGYDPGTLRGKKQKNSPVERSISQMISWPYFWQPKENKWQSFCNLCVVSPYLIDCCSRKQNRTWPFWLRLSVEDHFLTAICSDVTSSETHPLKWNAAL